MTDESDIFTIQAFDDLLEEERALLLVGDLEGLAAMHDRKSMLIDAFSQLDPPETDLSLKLLNAKVERNQALLDSALAGIKSVSRRLDTVKRVKDSLEYYDQEGSKETVDIGVARQVEKRA